MWMHGLRGLLRRREVFYVASTLAVAGGVPVLAALDAPVVVVLTYIGRCGCYSPTFRGGEVGKG
jgi:hypothetical protein